MSSVRLYHTGFGIIKSPDIYFGRKNADFGQGFYLSDDKSFSERWARERRDETTYINEYSLDTDALNIKIFRRDREWFEYIFRNRSGYDDILKEYDVITGPIANDTIYDTWGITTSGMLKSDDALKLLMIGPEYKQTVIKSEKAAEHLMWLSAKIITGAEIAAFRDTVRAEEEKFRSEFSDILVSIADNM